MKLLSPRLLCVPLAIATLSAAPLASARADEVNRISVGVGYYDVFGNDNDGAADFRVEYRPGTSIIWELRPWLGLEVTSDSAVYGAAGFLYDFHLAPQWILTPSIGAGLYSNGNGKDLDSTIEFRSMVELGYEFQNASRLSAGLSHISNAGTGDHNPGAEVLNLYYHIPINWVKQGPGGDSY